MPTRQNDCTPIRQQQQHSKLTREKKAQDSTQVAAVVFQSSADSNLAALIPADAVISCVGYAGEKIKTVPFDEEKRVIPTDERGRVEKNKFLYSVGWARYGPKGVIAASLADAKLISKTILEDLEKWNQEFAMAKKEIAAAGYSDG